MSLLGGNFRPPNPYEDNNSSNSSGTGDQDDLPFEEQCPTFEESARYFNNGQYYAAHDAFEAMWNEAQGPQRVLYHALVQCSVGMVHLLTTNHRGAMLEFGEGVRKLERLDMEGELEQFREEMLALQDFVYSTQIEFAACDGIECYTMSGDEESYERLGDFGKGEELYQLVKSVVSCELVGRFDGTVWVNVIMHLHRLSNGLNAFMILMSRR